MPACSASTRSQPSAAARRGGRARPRRRRRRRARRRPASAAGPSIDVGDATPRRRAAHADQRLPPPRAGRRRLRTTGRRRPGGSSAGRLVEGGPEPGVAAAAARPGSPRPARARRWSRPRAAWASEATSSVRTTSSSRGSSITATSDPPAKSTCPWHHEKSSPTRWAPSGPSSSGSGIEPSERPPVADALARPAVRDPGAAVTMRVTAIGDMALTTTPRGRAGPSCQVSDGDGALGAAVRAGVGRPPARAGRDAEDAAAPGRRHDRQRGAEDVEVAVEVHREHAEPVLLGAVGEARRPGDAGDVDHGVEAAVLVDQLARTARGLAVPSVTDTADARAGAAGGDDAPGGGLLGRGELLGAVEGDERVHRDDEGAVRPSSSAIAAPIPPPPPVTTTTALAGRVTSTLQPVEVDLLARASPRAARGSRSSRRSPGRSCRCAGSMPPGSPSLLMRDGVHADMTRAGVDEGVDDLLDPVRLGLGAHVEHLDALLRRAGRPCRPTNSAPSTASWV